LNIVLKVEVCDATKVQSVNRSW